MSAPRKYRKKPVVIEAIQYDGRNAWQISSWVGTQLEENGEGLLIPTLEGTMLARKPSIDGSVAGSWVIRGVDGEHYPCEASIFEKTYEPLGEM